MARSEPKTIESLLREPVVVNQLDGDGLMGVPMQVDETGILLVPSATDPVSLLQPGGGRMEIKGSVFVPMSQVKFVQRPTN